ncbi:hemin ABC transporter substrate-binding protein [Comamonas sp. GB3 AK4-5]|uniref:heme/hemin ABC transporter substrate-binding protein n=1 Tax=Comamonas sp. GB3 AK4-5 TaxID=3231487 RepID=UPI00351F3773
MKKLNLKRRAALQRLVAGTALAWTGAGWGQAAASKKEAAGAVAARRIISLGGAVTEAVYALGAEHMLVATDTTSLYPDAAARTPKVGYLRQLSAEGVLSLRPGVVIGAGESGPATVLDQLRAAGVQVEVVAATHDWAEVLAKLRMAGRATGRQAAAEALALQLQQQWQATQAEVVRARTQPRALFILAHSGTPMVAGTGTAAHALLQMAGAQNVVQQFAGYRPLAAEAMAAVAPQVLVTTTQGLEAMGGEQAFWKRPELALTPAHARRALVAMEANHLMGFGPRLPSAVRQLHTQLLQQVVA